MTKLRLVASETDVEATQSVRDEASPPPAKNLGPRRLAPGAPESPGTVPLELAMLLRRSEPAVWWNEKDHVTWSPVLWTAVLGVVLILFASLLAPELWVQPWHTLWRPIVVPFLPAFGVWARELMSRRAVMVTDTSVIEIPVWGESDRIAFRNVRVVKRDLLTGGVLLQGDRHRVRVPPALMEDCRRAIASQTRNQLSSGEAPEDRLGWLP